MRIANLTGALALALMLAPAAARADDPKDPAMQGRDARERDRAVIRKLNEDELARTTQRDAEYASGWQAYRDYPQRQAEYERAMAEWRRAVELCRAGRWEYCSR